MARIMLAILLINSIDLINSCQYMLYFKHLYLLSHRFNKQLQKFLGLAVQERLKNIVLI